MVVVACVHVPRHTHVSVRGERTFYSYTAKGGLGFLYGLFRFLPKIPIRFNFQGLLQLLYNVAAGAAGECFTYHFPTLHWRR